MDIDMLPNSMPAQEQQQQPPMRYKRPKMGSIHYLDARRERGANASFASPAGCRTKIRAQHMASVMAWNPARLQNMSLAIGPGTPAAVIMAANAAAVDDGDADDDSSSNFVRALYGNGESSSSESSGSSDSEQDVMEGVEEDMENLNGEEKTDDDEEEDTDQLVARNVTASDEATAHASNVSARARRQHDSPRSRFVRSSDATLRQEAYRILQRRLREEAEAETATEGGGRQRFSRSILPPQPSDASAPPLERVRCRLRARELTPSIRHGGCINTACWLDVPWRFSTVNEQAGTLRSIVVESYECPTQMVTSGDDRLLKVWDCSGAMGMDNPLPGGWNTFSPFCMLPPEDDDAFQQEWKEYYAKRADYRLGVSGTTRNLKTMATGHRGNVFHVTPLKYDPGKFLTCGADGCLRLVDTANDKSSIAYHPYLGSGVDESIFGMHSSMAYSHITLTASTGLICSERGLHHFDLRISPQDQLKRSLLHDLADDEITWRSSACKACAVWNPHGESQHDLESTYVFAGGASEAINLFDLRMDASKGRIIQRYRPEILSFDENHVSVSGLDVSKDSRELLVSYESDQIYTFPIMQSVHCPAGPTMEDMDLASMHHECSNKHAIYELASYGGHLNRFTFLKNAKYAGPNDEYICTGSDSGHAWFYERKTGTVVSLLGADRTTCNGAVPHPLLPFFITYGIESTAKLWRGSGPVDQKADDSSSGRQKCSLIRKHELSPVTKTWDGVQSVLRHLEPLVGMLPDCVASSEEISASGRFSGSIRRGICGSDSPKIGNGLLELPSILRQNQYECLSSFVQDHDFPIEQTLVDFIQHVNICRLRFQADRVGFVWNPWRPYTFVGENSYVKDLHLADLVPDFPSDWVNFDRRIIRSVMCPRQHFALDRNHDLVEWMVPGFFDSEQLSDPRIPWLDAEDQAFDDSDSAAFEDTSRRLIYKTALLCKEGGNDAMKAGLYEAAARRYDKAIQYAAPAIMKYGNESEDPVAHFHVPYRQEVAVGKGTEAKSESYLTWSEPLKLVLMCRLNLSLLFLKRASPDQAAIQARAALRLLAPFCAAPGKIGCSTRSDKFVKEDEPAETHSEAKALQAKAYFRPGSAAFESGDFLVAVKSFEASLAAASYVSGSVKPDPLTVRLLRESKQKHRAKKKRTREKYHRMLETASENETDGRSNEASSSPSKVANAPFTVTPETGDSAEK